MDKGEHKEGAPKIKITMENKRITALLPAAGVGDRMGHDVPKQFIEIHRKPLICYTVESFLKIPWIKEIVVVTEPETVTAMSNILLHLSDIYPERIKITAGGDVRHDSIHLGLKYIQEYLKCDIVVIHDAVRPFLDEDVLEKVVHNAMEFGASGVIVPLVSTVLGVNDETNELTECLDRNKLKASEMPQAFQFNTILEAYEQCSKEDMQHGTECLHLVQKYMNINAKLVPGTTNSWKVTYKRDLYAAKGILKENQSADLVIRDPIQLFPQILEKCVTKKFKKVRIHDGPFNEQAENIVVVHPFQSLREVLYFALCWPAECSEYWGLTIVHILFDNPSLNIIHKYQRISRRNLEEPRLKNRTTYYIITDGEKGMTHTAEVATSLLCESNPALNGQILFI